MPNARVLTGSAGLGYVVGAAIENMGLLDAPAGGAGAAQVRVAYADHALQLVSWLAGAVSLLCFCAFAVGLHRLGAGRRWSLAGALVAVALAASALAASAPLVDGAAGLTDERVESLFSFREHARLAAGGLMALFLLGAGAAAARPPGRARAPRRVAPALPPGRVRPALAALRAALRAAARAIAQAPTAVPALPAALRPAARAIAQAPTAVPALPAALRRAARGIAPALLLGPLAAATGDDSLRIAALAALGLHSLWIAAAGLWLALGPRELARRAAFLVLALAAGLVGIALLAAPAATGSFFAWELKPAPLAAFAGGVYVASAVVYAAALRATWHEVRGLVVAATVLSLSVLAITLVHLDVFDLHRLQAWAWIALFALFGAVMVALAPRPAAGSDSPRLAPAARALLWLVAGLLAPLAGALWIDPTAVSGSSPFELAPLGGRFAGSWIAMLATMAGWASLRGRHDEARFPALAIAVLPLGALAAALRTGDPAIAYLLALALLSAAGLAVLAASATRTPSAAPRADAAAPPARTAFDAPRAGAAAPPAAAAAHQAAVAAGT